MSETTAKLNQITKEVNAICNLAEKENRPLHDEEVMKIGILSRRAQKYMKLLLRSPFAV